MCRPRFDCPRRALLVVGLLFTIATPPLSRAAKPAPLSGKVGRLANPSGKVGRIANPSYRQADEACCADLLCSLGQVRCPEIVEMLWAIANGSQMGPGEGWFHEGKSRYGWQWLARRYDANRDGRITRKEFKGPAELFDRLDRDHDGVLTAADFDWSDRSPLVRQNRLADTWFYRLDGNSNGRISRAEWDAFFKQAAQGKNHLTPDDLRAALAMPPPKKGAGAARGGPTPEIFIRGLLSGELGSYFEGPAIGDKAPDFKLPLHDGTRKVRLSQFRRKKPVVLVFGSFT
jgi:hypothetical protein